MIDKKRTPYFEVPLSILKDKNIDKTSVCVSLYGWIMFLCSDKGFCTVSNEELANFLGCGINEISNGLYDLIVNGYVYIKMVIDDKQSRPTRMIYIKGKAKWQ